MEGRGPAVPPDAVASVGYLCETHSFE
jgi:hypothetical protein